LVYSNNGFWSTYLFFIVLIGVIVSRFFQAQQNQLSRNITGEDSLWAGISAIIALLIFSNFQQQVTLTRHIITNISLAFGFGFGFDRVLQTIKK
jgi:hypothetical protein